MAYKQVAPDNLDLGPIGSIAAGLPAPTRDRIGTTVQTYGVLRDVQTGNYRVWVEGHGDSNVTLIRGQIVVKYYR